MTSATLTFSYFTFYQKVCVCVSVKQGFPGLKPLIARLRWTPWLTDSQMLTEVLLLAPQWGRALVRMRESEPLVRLKSLKLRVGAPLGWSLSAFQSQQIAELCRW